MKKIKLFAIVAFVAIAGVANAQKIVEGDKGLTFLKGQTKFNIEYDYTDMMVGKRPEAEYKAEKVAKGNEKQPGKGDRWAEKWVNDRTSTFEPMFEELINKQLFKGGTNATAAKNVKDAKYTIRVKTIMTEPGFNSVVMKVNPSCKYEIYWVETSSGKVLTKGLLTAAGVNMASTDFDFDQSKSIKECYAKAGKVVGTTMAKKMK